MRFNSAPPMQQYVQVIGGGAYFFLGPGFAGSKHRLAEGLGSAGRSVNRSISAD